MNKELSKAQLISIVSGVVVAMGLLVFAAIQFRNRARAAPAPVELTAVREVVTAGPREEAGAAAPPPSSDETARRQEALQSLRFTAQHSR